VLQRVEPGAAQFALKKIVALPPAVRKGSAFPTR